MQTNYFYEYAIVPVIISFFDFHMLQEEIKDRPVLLFIGVILLLIGVYFSLRTIINFAAFEHYPQTGVDLSMPWKEYAPVGYQREEDCEVSYIYTPSLYYRADGVTPRPATKEETELVEQQKQQYELQKQSCIAGVVEMRNVAKINDISQSLIFLLLGGAVLLYRRLFKAGLLRINL
jgi:hypothetical protein